MVSPISFFTRAARVWDVAVIGDGAKVMENVYSKGMNGHRNPFTKDFYTNFWQTTKTAGKELEAYKAAEVAKHGSPWKVFANNFRRVPGQFQRGWELGGKYAARTGKNAFMCQMGGALKKGCKSLGRIAGPALLIAFELPNIFRATRDEGIGSGLIETGKAAARLGGFVGGAAIGQALIPIPVVGGLIGGILGDVLVSKIVGKSYTQKKEEQQEQLAKLQGQVPFTGGQATQPIAQGAVQGTVNPFQQQQNLAMMQQMMSQGSFSDDFMMKANGGTINLFA